MNCWFLLFELIRAIQKGSANRADYFEQEQVQFTATIT